MLSLEVSISKEGWDEKNEIFIEPKHKVLQLEHSLVSLSKWESKWHKAFLTKTPLTDEETLDYIRCMTLSKDVPPDIYNYIDRNDMQKIFDYIANPMTATTFSEREPTRPNRDVVTAELIYYWMISLGIPFECQKWHLNKLLTLIRVCNIKNQPSKKMSKGSILRSNAKLNAARRKRLNTRG